MYTTLSDLASKMDYEGGIYELLQYGVSPAEVPEDIRAEWTEAVEAADKLSKLERKLYDHLYRRET